MKYTAVFVLALLFLLASLILTAYSSEEKSRGAELFSKHCSACHPDAAKMKSDINIVAFMRAPVPPMPAFKVEKISDEDAQFIAAYIRLRIYSSRMSKSPT